MTIEILNCEQGSGEWVKARLGIPTASEFASILAKGQGKTRRTYMMKLIGERFTGEPADNYTNPNMERGKIMEAEARAMYAFMEDQELRQVGFIRNGDKGCSPDSLIDEDGLLEIKTALPHIQIERLLANQLPPEHMAQVQGQLWVSERQWCDFVSYWPRLPLFVTRVRRDEEYIRELAGEVDRFLAELMSLENKIKTMQGQAEPLPLIAAG